MKKRKIARDAEEAFKIQEKWQGKPHGWIQWKGTRVCMDVHCVCGKMSHIDGDFVYFVKCPNCGRVYYCNGHIELIELERVDADLCFVTDEFCLRNPSETK